MQKILIYIGLLVLLGGCAHKIEIQQGNRISEEQLAKVVIGMDKHQVRFLLGTPLLHDPFHQSRWDYYYSLEQEGERVSQYSASLYFVGENLARIERHGPIPAKEYPREEQGE